MLPYRLPTIAAALLAATASEILAPTSGFAQAPAARTPALPDACRLLPLSDLNALYPGRSVTSKGPGLSPISRGPQYAESCQYALRLPSGTSQRDIARFASLAIVRFADVPDKGDAARSFAYLRELREHLANDPTVGLTISSVPGVGDEAFAEIRQGSIAISVRKQDLLFVVTADVHADDTLRNVSALARQAAGRWREGVGMVEYDGAVERNGIAATPTDTRPSSVAPAQDWPDACTLLVPADLRQIFPGATIGAPRRVAGQVTHERRENRVERLPKPIACLYDVRRVIPAGGQARPIAHIAQVSIKNVAAGLALSRRFYEVSQKVVGPLTPLEGLGDEAGIDALNRIAIRKGLVSIEVKVTGGERDAALHAEARERAIELARIAVRRLP